MPNSDSPYKIFWRQKPRNWQALRKTQKTWCSVEDTFNSFSSLEKDWQGPYIVFLSTYTAQTPGSSLPEGKVGLLNQLQIQSSKANSTLPTKDELSYGPNHELKLIKNISVGKYCHISIMELLLWNMVLYGRNFYFNRKEKYSELSGNISYATQLFFSLNTISRIFLFITLPLFINKAERCKGNDKGQVKRERRIEKTSSAWILYTIFSVFSAYVRDLAVENFLTVLKK